MAKSRDAFRTISEVAEWLDIQAHVLRFWESKFTQVKPIKRAGGRRYYRRQDMLLLGGIKKLLHDDGLTIKGAQKLLREEGIKHVSAMSQALDDDSDAVKAPPATLVSEPSDTPAPDTPSEMAPETLPKASDPAPGLFDEQEQTVETTFESPDETAQDSAEASHAPTELTDAKDSEQGTDQPAVSDASLNEEIMEDFIGIMCNATHIRPDMAAEAAALAARFATVYSAAQETVQA